MKGNPHCMPYHCERGYGVSGIVACPPFIEAPIIRYDFRRELDPTGILPVWRNLGTLGASVDATGAGGAANPTILTRGLPGYTFDGGDRFTLGGSNPLLGNPSFTILAWVYLSSVALGSRVLSSQGAGGGQVCHPVANWGVAQTWGVEYGASGYRSNAGALPAIGVYHLGIRKPAGAYSLTQLFVNGVQVAGALVGADGTPNFAAAPGFIGSYSGGILPWAGAIYSFYEYLSALPADVIRYLYERDRHLVGA